jgi:hypothetical protein
LTNGLLTLANSLKQTLIGLLTCSHFIELRIVLMDPLLESCPEVFDWIQIRAVRWPFHYWYALIFKLFLDLLNCMDTGIILHERHAWLPRLRDLFAKNGEIGVRDISWLLWIRIAFHYNHIWTPISMNSTLDYDADILAFFIRLYYAGVPLLFRRTEDLNASRPRTLFKATFVALNCLALFILSLISMLFSLLEMFNNYF